MQPHKVKLNARLLYVYISSC